MALNQTTADVSFAYPGFLKLKVWISLVLRLENCMAGDITIVFCSDEYLLSINSQFLNHHYYTDVITFDYSDGNTLSGDIMISIERVKENALSYNCDFKDELDRVILHGVLHLAGYRDSNEEDIKAMRSKEEHYLMFRKP